MKKIGLLSLLLCMGIFAFAQSGADKLFKEGKLKEASEAWIKESYAQTGTNAQDLVTKALTIDPDLKHLISLLSGVSANHKDTSVRAISARYLGLLYLASGQYTLSRQWYGTASSLNINDHESRIASLALALYEGKLEELRIGIDQAMAAKPPAEAIEGIGIISALYLNATSRSKEALNMLDQIAFENEKPTAQSLATGVYIAQNAGNSEKAKQYYEKLVKLYPSNQYTYALKSDSKVKASPLFLILGMATIPSTAPEIGQVKKEDKLPTNITFVQLGLFSKKDFAQALFEKVQTKGFSASILDMEGKFKVVCPVPPNESPERFVLRLRDSGFEAFVIK